VASSRVVGRIAVAAILALPACSQSTNHPQLVGDCTASFGCPPNGQRGGGSTVADPDGSTGGGADDAGADAYPAPIDAAGD